MDRLLLQRLNRLLSVVPQNERKAHIQFLLSQAFGVSCFAPKPVTALPQALAHKAQQLIATYPLGPEGTTHAVTPAIFSLVHEQNAAQRKSSGIFYTPWAVADLLARETLFAVLTRQAGLTPQQARLFLHESSALKPDTGLARFLTTLCVCDPACGTGGLLLPFALRWAQLYQKTNPNQPITEFLTHFFKHNLYGTDIDDGALAVFQLRAGLLLRQKNEKIIFRPVLRNLRCQNALTAEHTPLLTHTFPAVFVRKKGFDVLLSNPPFVGQKNHAAVFESLKRMSFWQDKIAPKSDLLYLFFYLAFELLRPDGCAGFITTPYFTTSAGAGDLRRQLQRQTAFLRLIDFGETRLFAQAGQHTLLSIFQKTPQRPPCLCGSTPIPVGQTDLYSGADNYLQTSPPNNPAQNVLLNQMAQCRRTLGQVAQITNGLMSGCDKISAAHIKKFPQYSSLKGAGVFVLSQPEKDALSLLPAEEKKLKPFFKNSDISAYTAAEKPHYYLVDIFYPNDRRINWQQYPHLWKHLLRFKPILLARKQNNNGIDKQLAQGHFWFGSVRRRMDFEGEKLLVPHRCATNKFAYCAQPWYASSDVYFISKPKDNISLWYLLALFNSKPYGIWLRHFGKRKGSLLELYTAPLRQLPVPTTDSETQRTLENLAQAVYHLKKQALPAHAAELEINRRLCALFGLNQTQTEQICQFPL